MKILDIITPTQLDEGLGWIPGAASAASGVATLLGKGLKTQAKELLASKIAIYGGLHNVPDIVKYLMKVPGMTASNASKLAADSNFLSSAEKLAAKNAKSAVYAANITAIKTAFSGITTKINSLVKFGINAYMVKQLFDIWEIVYTNAETMQKDVDEGQLSADQFAVYKQKDVDTATVKTVAWLASGALAKIPLGVVSNMIGWLAPKTGKIASFLGSSKRVFNTSVQLYIMTWINSPEGNQVLGNFIGGSLASPVGGIVGKGFDAAEDKLISVLSGQGQPTQ